MICIDSSASLDVVLGEAATTQLPINSTYMDVTQATGAGAGPYPRPTATNSTTAVQALQAPAAGVGRQLAAMSISNKDGVAHTVYVRTNVSSTLYQHTQSTLQVGETLVYEHGAGWSVLDSSGRPLSSSASYPTGSITAYGGAAAPTGWVLCDGASLVRADYAALFAVLGTTFGAADGTHFNVPDLRGRAAIGVGTGVEFTAALGTDYGAEKTVLAATDIPAHTHPGPAGTAYITYEGAGTELASGSYYNISTYANTGASATASTNPSVMQPSLGLNYIIKT